MSQYAPQTDEFDLSDATVEEMAAAAELYNALVPAARRVDPRRPGGLAKKAEAQLARVFGTMRQARGAAATYVVATVYDLLDAAEDLEHFRELFTERAGNDPRT